MQFGWPAMLWSLAALPLLVAAYAMHLSRRRALARRYASLAMVAEARAGATLPRHAPAALLLVAIATLLVSAARPSIVLPLPSHHETVILAVDVSHSMRADDVRPNRLAAAKAAAKAFIAEQRPSTRIGLVAFSGDAALVQAPTDDREAIEAAVDSLQTQDATAIGSAILASLQALLPQADIVPDAPGRDALYGTAAIEPVDPGTLKSTAVILLSDGQNTVGPDAMDAAYLAADHGVRVYTVGFGTLSGTTVGGPGWSVHVYLDESLLRNIAATTRAEYFHASTASELKNVYRTLSSTLALETKPTELTATLCIAAVLAALLAAGLSLVSYRPVA
jgi:Ca-activated chloride channel family protein